MDLIIAACGCIRRKQAVGNKEGQEVKYAGVRAAEET